MPAEPVRSPVPGQPRPGLAPFTEAGGVAQAVAELLAALETHPASSASAGPAGSPPPGLLLLATRAWAPRLAELRSALAEGLPGAAVAAVAVEGLLAGGRERNADPVAALLPAAALASCAGSGAPGEELASRLAPPTADPGRGLALLLFDPLAADAELLARRLWERRPGGCLSGIGAATGVPILSESGRSAAALAAVLQAASPRIDATHACRRIGPFHRVSEARGHWVFRLDGRPALDLLRTAVGGRLAEDPRTALRHVVAVRRGALESGSRDREPDAESFGEFTGYCDRRRALCLGAPAARGERLAFGLRDASAALGDLRALLGRASGTAGPGPRETGLYLTCRARDASLFGLDDLEAAYLDRAFPDLAVLGIRGPSPIAALGAPPARLPHAGVLALLGPATPVDRPGEVGALEWGETRG